MAKDAHFDTAGFFQALEAERASRGLTWKKVADEAHVSASTLTRMGQGARPDVDGLASLSSWSGLDPRSFFLTDMPSKDQPEPLAAITTYLRGDPNLSKESSRMLLEIIKTAYEQLRTDETSPRVQD